MVLRNTKILLQLSLLFGLMSCQPGNPIVTVLGEVSGFDISQNIQRLNSKTDKDVFIISGRCFGMISDVQISFDNGSSFESLSQHAETSNLNCASDGTFSYTINPNNKTLFDIPLDQSYKDFKIRGLSEFGATTIHNFRRMISNTNNLQITAGSTRTSTFKGRIISSASQSQQGSNYKFKGALKIK